MMQSIGVVEHTCDGYRLTKLPGEQGPQPQAPEEEQEEEEGEVDDMVMCMDNLELQMSILDTNIEELTRSVFDASRALSIICTSRLCAFIILTTVR